MFPLDFQSSSSFPANAQSELKGSRDAVRREERTVGGEEKWRCADGTFMMSCVSEAWSGKSKDKGREKGVSARRL